MSDKRIQKGGKDSLNIQSQETTINVGVTYTEAKQIAQDVFEANFYRLSKVAADVAKQRANEFIEKYLTQLNRKDPDLLNSTSEPDIQYGIFNAGKEYARSGDNNLCELLVNILVERSQTPQRTLLQIVLNEAIEVAPKLTSNQWDALSIALIIYHTTARRLKTISDFRKYVEAGIVPFIRNLPSTATQYRHLVYTGCVTLGNIITSDKLATVFKTNFPYLVCKGFPKKELVLILGKDADLDSIVTKNHVGNDDLYLLDALDEETIEALLREQVDDNSKVQKLKELQRSTMMSSGEIRDFLIGLHPSLEQLFTVFVNSSLQRMTLTSVGMVIANANIERRTGESIDLASLIK